MNDEKDVTTSVANAEIPRVSMAWEPPNVTLTRTEELGRLWLTYEGGEKWGTSVAFFARVVTNPKGDDPTAQAAESAVEYLRNFIAIWASPEAAEGLSHPPSVVMAAPDLLAACRMAFPLFSGEGTVLPIMQIRDALRDAIAKAGGAA